MEQHKYELGEDRTCLVLKEGVTARLGMVVYTPTHDIIRGSNNGYSEVEICLRDFRRSVVGEKAKESLPHFLQYFTDGDIADLCRMSKHCDEAPSELVELIRLSKEHEKDIIRITSCGSYCARNSAKVLQTNNIYI